MASARVVPARMQQAGFQFAFPELEPALRHELGRKKEK
jgi:NAD dependent epimerase/dehydratase family enzyme